MGHELFRPSSVVAYAFYSLTAAATGVGSRRRGHLPRHAEPRKYLNRAPSVVMTRSLDGGDSDGGRGRESAGGAAPAVILYAEAIAGDGAGPSPPPPDTATGGVTGGVVGR